MNMTATTALSLRAEQVGLGSEAHWRLQPQDLTLQPGEILAICGPNGAGKSTLLGVLAGELQPDTGRVDLSGRLLQDWAPAELARCRARLEQDNPLSFDFLAEEVVALGRYSWGDDQPDAPVVLQAMQAAGAADLRGRKITRLSGGERQRVQLARVLAQVWAVPGAVLLLDEPLSAQDMGQQQQIFRQLRQLAREHQWAVACVLHDLNVAALFADSILLLEQGCQQALGTPEEVFALDRLSRLYQAELTSCPHPRNQRPMIMLDETDSSRR